MSRNIKQTVLGGHLGLALNGAKTYQALTGTIAVTNGSTTLTGTGTNFDPDVSVGQTIGVKTNTDAINPEITFVTISAIASDTSLTLDAAWSGDTLTGLTGYREAANLASRTIKPVSTIPANWLPLGTVLKPSYKANAEYDDVIAPSPAAMERTGQLYKGSKPMWELTMNEISEEVLQSVFRTGSLTNSTPFTPSSSNGLILGWWQLKAYDQAGNLALLIEQFGAGTVDELTLNDGQVKPSFKVAVYHNSLATGTSTLAALTT